MIPENDMRPDDDRRAFLKKCGKFAVITPPAVTFLLSTSMSSKAIAGSSGRIRDGDGNGGGLLGVLGAGAAGAGAVAVAGAPTPEKPFAPQQVAAPAQESAPLAAPPPPPAPVPSSVGERG